MAVGGAALATALLAYLTGASSRTAGSGVDVSIPVRVVAADLSSGAQSVSEFGRFADLGLVATAAAAEEVPNAVDPTIVATRQTFRVEQVLWGETPGRDVVVVYTGGVVREGAGTPYRLQLEDQPPFVTGDIYVLGLIGPSTDGSYMILGGPQGRYRVLNGTLRTESATFDDPIIRRFQGLDVAEFAHAVTGAR